MYINVYKKNSSHREVNVLANIWSFLTNVY